MAKAETIRVDVNLDTLAREGAEALGISTDEYRGRLLALLGNLVFGEPVLRELEDGRREYVWVYDPREEVRTRAGVEAIG